MRSPPWGIALDWPKILQAHDWSAIFCLTNWQNVSQVVVTSKMSFHVFMAQEIGVFIVLLYLFFLLTLFFRLVKFCYIVESRNTIDHLFVRNAP